LSLRGAFGAIVVGLLVALGMFFWTEVKTGRIADLGDYLREAERAGPPAVVTRPPPSTPTLEPRATAAPARATATSGPTAVPTRAPTPTDAPVATAPSRPTGPAQVGLTGAELDAELKRQVVSGGIPLRNPALSLAPPDRLILRGAVPVAIFQIPVEVEAQLTVEDGQVKVTTTRVDAIGASLPQSVATSLGQQVDALGSQAVRAALPAGTRARKVTVDSERVTVDLAGS
jgi:hypothetical protein